MVYQVNLDGKRIGTIWRKSGLKPIVGTILADIEPIDGSDLDNDATYTVRSIDGRVIEVTKS